MNEYERSSARLAAVEGIAQALTLAHPDDRKALLWDALVRLDRDKTSKTVFGVAPLFSAQPQPVPSSSSLSTAKVNAEPPALRGLSGAVVDLLSDGTPRLIPEIAIAIYKENTAESKNKARALLSFLAKSGKVQQLNRGQWALGGTPQMPPISEDGFEQESLRAAVLRALEKVTLPGLSSEDLVLAVRSDAQHKNANPQSVRALLSQLLSGGELSRSGLSRREYRYALARKEGGE